MPGILTPGRQGLPQPEQTRYSGHSLLHKANDYIWHTGHHMSTNLLHTWKIFGFINFFKMQTSSASFHLYRVTLANTICNINTVTGKARFKMDDMSNIITSLSNTICLYVIFITIHMLWVLLLQFFLKWIQSYTTVLQLNQPSWTL